MVDVCNRKKYFCKSVTPCFIFMQLNIFLPPSFLVLHRQTWQLVGKVLHKQLRHILRHKCIYNPWQLSSHTIYNFHITCLGLSRKMETVTESLNFLTSICWSIELSSVSLASSMDLVHIISWLHILLMFPLFSYRTTVFYFGHLKPELNPGFEFQEKNPSDVQCGSSSSKCPESSPLFKYKYNVLFHNNKQ